MYEVVVFWSKLYYAEKNAREYMFFSWYAIGQITRLSSGLTNQQGYKHVSQAKILIYSELIDQFRYITGESYYDKNLEI